MWAESAIGGGGGRGRVGGREVREGLGTGRDAGFGVMGKGIRGTKNLAPQADQYTDEILKNPAFLRVRILKTDS